MEGVRAADDELDVELKRVVLLSGALRLSGSTTWILNLHKGFLCHHVDVVHIVLSDASEIVPDFGRTVYTGRARASSWLRVWRWAQLHRLLPRVYDELLERESSARVDAVLRKLGWESQVDLVIKDFTSDLPSSIARFPVVAVVHQMLSHSWGNALRKAAKQPARFFVPVSKVVGADAQGVGVAALEPIYNPLDRDWIAERAVAFEPAMHKPYIVYVGRLSSAKGVHDLLAAFSRLASNIDLIFVGRGEEQAALEEEARRLNVERRVHFLGFRENPYPYIRGARVLVLPSKSEAMSYVSIEAAALDVPIVVGGFDAACEFFSDDAVVPLQPEENFVSRLAERIEATIAGSCVGGVRPGVFEKMRPEIVAGQYLRLIEG